MNHFTDTLLVVLLLSCFLLLGTSRLAAAVRMTAVQGFMIGLLPLAIEGGEIPLRVAILAALIALLKAGVFPWLLMRTVRAARTTHEERPLVGYGLSTLIGVAAVGAAFWFDSRLPFSAGSESKLVVPVAFSVMATGLFLMVARRTAICQVLGYLTLENGIYIFGLAIVSGIPMLVELGVLMDMFVAVFVMGIAIYRISREFDHIDAAQLTSLKG
ncbi:MAG: hydrogenase [bacterium]